ncbi:hypothetical protein TWF102_005981 [Orbilia oligospora]|uniref:Uncharacterized protein n=1 Tax=Orbilia oligospora TaxID=2813651 RepID=A0A7C8J9P9_ORBOL|nr:hypothetical protein TWF102_005981 [Orbilia oligospora]KAF3108210.1 hypothetical protein TWF103_005753 [Orbilia oligospora]
MSSKDRYTGESSRSTYPSRRSYDYSDSESSDDTSSSSSESDYSHKPQRRRRSSSARRQYASDKLKGLTKAPQNQPVRRRRAVSESRSRRSDSESGDSSLEETSSGRRPKGDMSVASSSYNKRPKTKLEKKVDEVLDAFGLLHIKNNPSKRQLSSPDPEKYAKQKQALQAAVTAAAIEAWRSHSKPGGFNLQKLIRVLVAGIAAGGVDVLVENRPGHDKLRDIAEAVVGGLATSKTLGGKITHRREGGAQGTMIDGFIALAASKMVKPPKKDEIEWRKKKYAKRSRSMEPSKQKQSSPRKR